MFEHMKNYGELMAKIANWLNPAGQLFVHIFTHKQFAYHFDKGLHCQRIFFSNVYSVHISKMHYSFL